MKKLTIGTLLLLFFVKGYSQSEKSKFGQSALKEKQNKEAFTSNNCPLGYIDINNTCNLRVETNQGIDKRWAPIVPKPSKDTYQIKDGIVNGTKVTMNIEEVNQRLILMLAKVYSIKKTEIRFVNDKPVLYCLAISYQIDAQQVLSIPLILEKGVALLTTDLVTITTLHKGKTTIQSTANTAFQQNDYIGHVTLLK